VRSRPLGTVVKNLSLIFSLCRRVCAKPPFGIEPLWYAFISLSLIWKLATHLQLKNLQQNSQIQGRISFNIVQSKLKMLHIYASQIGETSQFVFVVFLSVPLTIGENALTTTETPPPPFRFYPVSVRSLPLGTASRFFSFVFHSVLCTVHFFIIICYNLQHVETQTPTSPLASRTLAQPHLTHKLRGEGRAADIGFPYE
jgi:hypothetical protein